MSAGRKLNIFPALEAMDRRDGDWLSRQPEDAQRDFHPSVAVRWLSAVTGEAADYYLVVANERLNAYLWDLYAYPDLLWRLAASCGVGVEQHHEWPGMMGRRKTGGKARDLLGELHPHASEAEVDMLLDLQTRESFTALVARCGLQASEAKEMLKAYDAYAGSRAPRKAGDQKAEAAPRRKAT